MSLRKALISLRHSGRSSLYRLCRHQQHEHQQHGLLRSPQDLADILGGGEIRRHRQPRFDRRLLSLQSRQLWRRQLLDRRQSDVQRDARSSFFRGRLEICGEVRCLRRVHVLASRQWAGERLPQSQHDRSDGRPSLPILGNARPHVPDHGTRSRRRGDRMNGLDWPTASGVRSSSGMPSFSRARADADSFPYGGDSMRNRGRPLAIPLRTDELAPAAGSPEQ
jgi:hypothetical protein